jgi:lipopolysaccharide transport system ATP-binding protein
MRVRLAFSVAAYLEPEILLVDEVLAVGDAVFQKKCLGKMDQIGESGKTVFLVSHNMGSIGKLCKRSILLKNGGIVYDGQSNKTISKYMEKVSRDQNAEILYPDNDKMITIKGIKILNHNREPNTQLERLKPFSIEVQYNVKQTTDKVFLSFSLSTLNGSVTVLNAREEEDTEVSDKVKYIGNYVTILTFPGGLINVGTYQTRIGITKNIKPSIDKREGPSFDIVDNIKGNFRSAITPYKRGVLSIGLDWHTEYNKNK